MFNIQLILLTVECDLHFLFILSRITMNLLKVISYCIFVVAGVAASVTAFADTVELPVLKTLAEPELRAETGIIQYQEDPARVKSLQHEVMKLSDEAQNFMIAPNVLTNVEILPAAPLPNLNSLPLILQQHILSIAQGLQSSDPKQGLYIMLQPFGIDRNATNAQIGREQFSIDKIDRQLGSGEIVMPPSNSLPVGGIR